MTTTPIQSDMVLWHTLRRRRHRSRPLHGIDALANRWVQRGRQARKGVRYLRRQALAAAALEEQYTSLTDAQLDQRIADIRIPFARRNQTLLQLCAALAIVREVASRQTNQKPYVEQLMGAVGMFHGQIVEMVTGEGKTLAAAVAATLLGWLRRPVHLVTVNDYLAKRDAQWNRPIFERCGLEIASVINDTPDDLRAAAYMQPLVYTTQKELVADWLRDELRLGRITEPVSARWLITPRRAPGGAAAHRCPVLVPGLHVAIVDELDAVLIDEAVTPLIIAQPRRQDPQADLYQSARHIAEALAQEQDFIVEAGKRRVLLTGQGQRRLAQMVSAQEHAIWRSQRRREELIEQALTALFCYHEGRQYQIVEDQVVIVDEYTGRFMVDRQWQHGLHQAVEAKHDLEVTADRDTLASMSFQRFFRQYPHLCGMTGTAIDARAELETTYGLPVRVIPTHRPLRRTRWPDRIYATASAKWQAVVEQVQVLHEECRPVLIGTRSIEASQLLSSLLSEQHLDHQVLSAVHHEAEAQIITRAGELGAVTVATNMAGRGTDIKLGSDVAQRGGLHVILTERHGARRIDRQLFGRSGRQGDPGSAQCIICLEDDLLLQQAPRTIAWLRKILGSHDRPLPRGLRVLFYLAQTRAQRHAYRSRASVVRHEDELDRTLPR